MRTLPLGPILFIFMQSTEKFDLIIGWCPFWDWRPPQKNPGPGTVINALKIAWTAQLPLKPMCCFHSNRAETLKETKHEAFKKNN